MASADLANLAATVTAGYKETATLGTDGTWLVMLEKALTGDPDGGSGGMFRAYGVGTTQAAAETRAVGALNGQRVIRYGADTGAVSNGKKNINPHTRDGT